MSIWKANAIVISVCITNMSETQSLSKSFFGLLKGPKFSNIHLFYYAVNYWEILLLIHQIFVIR